MTVRLRHARYTTHLLDLRPVLGRLVLIRHLAGLNYNNLKSAPYVVSRVYSVYKGVRTEGEDVRLKMLGGWTVWRLSSDRGQPYAQAMLHLQALTRGLRDIELFWAPHSLSPSQLHITNATRSLCCTSWASAWPTRRTLQSRG